MTSIERRMAPVPSIPAKNLAFACWRRPAIVISNNLFNQKTGLAFVCPITSTNRYLPFHIKVPDILLLTGFIMADQMKSVDFEARKAKLIEKAPSSLIAEVLAILDAIIY